MKALNCVTYSLPLLLTALCLIGCSDDNSCVTSADCFQGDVCLSDGTCGPDVGSESNNGNGTPSENNTQSTPSNNTRTSCEIDPFANMCVEDALEDGDNFNSPAVPYESNTWCVEDVLTDPIRTYDATFCANDAGDAIRIPIVMWPAQGCLNSDQATVKVTFKVLNDTCNPDKIRVLPYGFGQYPDRVDWCAGEANNVQIRCTTSDDGLTHTFERIQNRINTNQMWDHYFWIEADENVQFDYRVTVEVIP